MKVKRRGRTAERFDDKNKHADATKRVAIVKQSFCIKV